MAFVDLFGATSGAVQGDLDVTHRRFEPVELDLLPRGLAWDREDPQLLAIVAAQMTELSRVDLRAEALEDELDPHKTFALIEDWLTELGLPECAPLETLEAKRAAVLAKLLAEGGHNQSGAWWTEALEALGYPPEFFLQGKDVMDVLDDVLDELTDEQWPFVWEILVWPGIDDALVVCFVNHNKLLGTLAIVHFMWTPVVVIADAQNLYGVACTTQGYVAALGTGSSTGHSPFLQSGPVRGPGGHQRVDRSGRRVRRRPQPPADGRGPLARGDTGRLHAAVQAVAQHAPPQDR